MGNAPATARLNWLDAAKGMGIALVVLGHAARHDMMAASAVCGFLSYFIYSFHMPFYFAISGYAFGLGLERYRDRPGSFFRRRAQSLLVPLLSFSIVVYLVFFLAYRVPGIAGILEGAGYPMYGIGRYFLLALSKDNPYSVHLWYLWVLFLMTAGCYLWLRRVKNKGGWIALLAFSASCHVVTMFVQLPEIPHRLLSFLVFFVLGAALTQMPAETLRLPRGVTAACWALLVINAPLVYRNLLSDHPWAMILQKWVLLGVVPCCVISLLRLAQRLQDSRALQWLGGNAYPIYLLHQPLCAFLGVVLYSKLGLPLWPVFILCAAASVGFPMLVVWLCRKIPFLGLLGKKLLNIG